MKLSNLANVLRSAGLTVVESPGWADRGYAGQDLRQVRGVLWHHTATNRTRYALQDAPTLSMCLNGRPDLPGPLCNIVFGRNGTVYLLAAGAANHAGAGSAPGVSTDMGNHYLIGIEMESSGIAPWDWTEDQIRIAPHLGAALERAYLGWLDESERLQLGHLEYSSQGRIDPAGWPGGMDGLRASINAVLSGSAAINPQGTITPQDDDFMALFASIEDFKAAVTEAVEPVHRVTREDSATNVLNKPVPYKDPETGKDTGTTTTLTTMVGFADFNAVQTRLNTDAKSVVANIQDSIARGVADLLAASNGGPRSTD
jgi:hypothetical protein